MALVQPRPLAPAVMARLEALFVEHVDAVYNVAYRVLWNRADAEDVVQATFIKAMTRLDQLRDAERVRPWLLAVAYREAIAVVRGRREMPTDPVELPDLVAVGACPAEAAIASEVAQILHTALMTMKTEERMAVVLRDVEGLAMKEVAEVLGIGASAAKMRVHRGRAALRQLVSTQEMR